MPVSYDLDQIERDYREGAARSFAAAMSGATSDKHRAALNVQRAMLDAAIIQTKVMIASIGNETEPDVMGVAFGSHVGGIMATTIGALSFAEAATFLSAFRTSMIIAAASAGDETKHVAVATGTRGGRA